MIPIDPRRPLPPRAGQIKVAATKPVERKGQSLPKASERRKKDRRQRPFRHRGAYEMRSGADRRDQPHIDDEV